VLEGPLSSDIDTGSSVGIGSRKDDSSATTFVKGGSAAVRARGSECLALLMAVLHGGTGLARFPVEARECLGRGSRFSCTELLVGLVPAFSQRYVALSVSQVTMYIAALTQGRQGRIIQGQGTRESAYWEGIVAGRRFCEAK
jgi:hypothetical protein